MITNQFGYTDVVEFNENRGRLVESYCDGVSKVWFNSKNSYEFVKTVELIRFKPEEL